MLKKSMLLYIYNTVKLLIHLESLVATLSIADMLVILTNLVSSINTLYPSNPLPSCLVSVSDGFCHIAVTANLFHAQHTKLLHLSKL
jgi:hypothetical protein